MPGLAGGEHEGVQAEVPAPAARGEVPAAPRGEEGPGPWQGHSVTSHHSRNSWAILIHSMVKVWWLLYMEQELHESYVFKP